MADTADDQTAAAAALNPFRVPSGPLGWLAGWFMGRDERAHRELVVWVPENPPLRLSCGFVGRYLPG